MSQSNALLDALTLAIYHRSNGDMIGKCHQLPSFVIEANGKSDGEIFDLLRQETMRRLDLGEQPFFCGTGKYVFTCAGKGETPKDIHLMNIDDHCCALSDEMLHIEAHAAADAWVSKVGARIYKKKRMVQITTKSLALQIYKAVKAARVQYQADKAIWEKKWEEAKLKRTTDLRQQNEIKQMIDQLVAEALRYVEIGGRLILPFPWAIRKPQATPAKTWHLMSPEEFDQRAEPQKVHETEEKNANGGITTKSWCENPGGSEMTAGGEQADFMIRCMAKYARDGDAAALQWMHHLAMSATSLFWECVDHQTSIAKHLSNQWRHIPFQTDGSLASTKLAKLKMNALEMPEPPQTNPKIDLTSKHHVFIERVRAALHFLMNSPPIHLPYHLHEDAPEWIHRAHEALRAKPQKNEVLHEVYWEIYEMAMTRTSQSVWKKQSRPRKEKEKFLKALRART